LPGARGLGTLVAAVGAGLVSTTRSQEPTGFLNRTIAVDGVTHRYQVYVPAEYSRAGRWPVILFLHGSGERGTDGLLQTSTGLGDGIRRHAERWPVIAVFPQAPPAHRWHGKVAHLALATLDRTLREFSTDADRVYLVGLSAGGNGVWNLAYRYPERFAALVAVCGWVKPTPERQEAILPPDGRAPYPVVAGRIRSLPTWIWHGADDSVVSVGESRRMAEALRSAGAEVVYTELAGVGHEAWTPAFDSPGLPRWLLAQVRPRAAAPR
jgi:predicted peptidase